MMQDKLGVNEFSVTQESLADLLGVRRTSVTLAEQPLQKAGILSYTRGSMKILNRRALEQLACECYTIMRRLSS